MANRGLWRPAYLTAPRTTAMSGEPQKSAVRTSIRKTVPDWFLKERAIFLRLGPKAGPIYARLRLLDSIGVRTPNKVKLKSGTRSFLFVCLGNIMRSPMAEAMLKQALTEKGLQDQVRVASAGLHATPGKAAHPWAIAALQEIGLPLTSHRAQLLTLDLAGQADVIFAVDFQNKVELLALFPEAQHKVAMLSANASAPIRYREIPDPYFGDLEATRRCYAALQTCVRNLAAELSSSKRADDHDERDTAIAGTTGQEMHGSD